MLTNGKTPVSKSAAKRFAEQSAQRAQQGNNAVAVQQQEQQSAVAEYQQAVELLECECADYLRGSTNKALADVREMLEEPGAEVDSSYILHDGVANLIIMALVFISVLGGKELREQRDSLDYLRESPLFGPIFGDILDHLETVTTTSARGRTNYWYYDPLLMEVVKAATTLAEVHEAVKLNGGNHVLAITEYSMGEAIGFTMESRGYHWLTDELMPLMGMGSSQQQRGGACASMIKGQQETVMPADTLDTARKVRYKTIKYPLISLTRGLYDIKESGFLDMLNWNVHYITEPFPVENPGSVYEFDQMLKNHAGDFYAAYLGKENVSSNFLKKYGNTPVYVYLIRRTVNSGDSTGLS